MDRQNTAQQQTQVLTAMSPEAFLTMVIIRVRPFLTSRYTGMKPPFPVLATWPNSAVSGVEVRSGQGK